MAKLKPFRRLTWKLFGVILLAAVLSLALGLVCMVLGQSLVSRVYCSPARTDARLKAVAASFREYVEMFQINVNEAERIGLWNQSHPDVKLFISANGTVVNSDRYGAELILVDSGLILRTDDAAQSATVVNVNFSGGTYPVQILEFSEERLYRLVHVAALTVGGVFFLFFVLLYHRRVTLAISRLAGQVRRVIHGELSLEILPTSADEIGNLAEDVNAMRLSVLDRLHREEEAWNANSQLIAAISHDVRTPLTALLGFLELLETQPDLPEDKRIAYLTLCSNKARILRQLTDELFSYTVLFGKPQPDTELVTYEAAPLMEQLLGEHTAELIAEGFQFDLDISCCCGQIRADAQHLNRVFGNLFSNIRKYALATAPVKLRVWWEKSLLTVELGNLIRHDAGLVESNKIGLRTCEKLMTAMGGSFNRKTIKGWFVVTLGIPGEPGT